MEKREVRKEISRAILRMDPEERTDRSSRIQDRVLALPEFESAGCVAAYVALPFEVSTLRIIGKSLARGKVLALPRTDWDAHRMDMIRVDDEAKDLVQGPKGIIEPVGDTVIPPEQIDFVVVPGRAFDGLFNRVGQGGGFYDVFMKSLRPDCLTCAVAFDMQVQEEVPVDEHDVRMGMIVTETEVLRATSLP